MTADETLIYDTLEELRGLVASIRMELPAALPSRHMISCRWACTANGWPLSGVCCAMTRLSMLLFMLVAPSGVAWWGGGQSSRSLAAARLASKAKGSCARACLAGGALRGGSVGVAGSGVACGGVGGL